MAPIKSLFAMLY